jgi:hypothetical protein
LGPAYGRRRLRRQSQPDLIATQGGLSDPGDPLSASGRNTGWTACWSSTRRRSSTIVAGTCETAGIRMPI